MRECLADGSALCCLPPIGRELSWLAVPQPGSGVGCMVVTIAHHPADALSTSPKLRLRPMSHWRVTLRKLGPGMRRALEFIDLNPGCTKREALQGAGHPW